MLGSGLDTAIAHNSAMKSVDVALARGRKLGIVSVVVWWVRRWQAPFLVGKKFCLSVLNSITALRLEQWRKIEAVTGWFKGCNQILVFPVSLPSSTLFFEVAASNQKRSRAAFQKGLSIHL